MSEEFRYIPYSPYDMNLKGLIKDGGVYNLKYAEASGKGLSGILLPGSMYDSDELLRDIEYMKQMYPDNIKRISRRPAHRPRRRQASHANAAR